MYLFIYFVICIYVKQLVQLVSRDVRYHKYLILGGAVYAAGHIGFQADDARQVGRKVLLIIGRDLTSFSNR